MPVARTPSRPPWRKSAGCPASPRGRRDDLRKTQAVQTELSAAAGEPTDEPTQTRPVADSTGALPRRPAFIRQCKVCKINTEKNILIEMATPKYFKVTQLRSAIALPQKKKETLLRLGLRRRHQTVFHRICPEQAGMIATVKELVKVELADEMLTKDEMREQRKSDPGFTIEKAASRTVSTSS